MKGSGMQRTTINPATIPAVNFDDLPPEMRLNVFNNLELTDLQNARKVSADWCRLYSAVRTKDLAQKTLKFLREPDCHLRLTNEMLQNIVSIIHSYPLYRKQFYAALREVRNRLASLVNDENPVSKAQMKVSLADVQNCLVQAFGVAAFFEDNLVAVVVTQMGNINLLARYFAPFVVLRDMLLRGDGKFELRLCNEIYTHNFLEKIYFANDELYFVLRTQPGQPLTLSQFINETMRVILDERQLSQLKSQVNQIAATLMGIQANYSASVRQVTNSRSSRT